MYERKRRLIFVVGNSRSGTTMMGRIMGKHPQVFTFDELHFFEQLWAPEDRDRTVENNKAEQLASRLLCIQRDGYLRQGDSSRFLPEAKELLTATGAKDLTSADIFDAFLYWEAAKYNKTIPCDQTPRNVFYIGEILELYPEARIINMIRDPRDVLLSQKRKWMRRFLGAKNIPLQEAFRARMNYHPITITKLWNASIRSAKKFADDPRVFSIRFEDLLSDPDSIVQKVCEFIEIPFDKNLLEVPQVGSSSGLDKPEEKGINKERAGSWQKGGLTSTEIFLCQWVAKTTMEKHGYEPMAINPNPLTVGSSVISLPVQIALALLLNLKRMRNITETIRRRLT
ncbi:sulfotransferase [Ancylothrix sp. C2]|uniref:sulfotransferase family protein n=1 Tax=Ancylothrix sp. D3o TaxID=2953691 RepID=UPI0021BA760D|nr:sulfotransferase [Ancylothrix sp. D3o]MCT7949342.1 sulfotransferase [Ancylothrix sp. D3o]